MKKKFLVLIMIICSLLIVGCSKEKNSTSSKMNNKVEVKEEGIFIDGAKIKEFDVLSVSNIFNFSIVFDNSNNKEIQFDCSQIEVKKGSQTMTIKYPDIKTVSANESYTQWGLPMSNTDGLKVGDSVDVYYGKTKLGTTKVR